MLRAHGLDGFRRMEETRLPIGCLSGLVVVVKADSQSVRGGKRANPNSIRGCWMLRRQNTTPPPPASWHAGSGPDGALRHALTMSGCTMPLYSGSTIESLPGLVMIREGSRCWLRTVWMAAMAAMAAEANNLTVAGPRVDTRRPLATVTLA